MQFFKLLVFPGPREISKGDLPDGVVLDIHEHLLAPFVHPLLVSLLLLLHLRDAQSVEFFPLFILDGYNPPTCSFSTLLLYSIAPNRLCIFT